MEPGDHLTPALQSVHSIAPCTLSLQYAQGHIISDHFLSQASDSSVSDREPALQAPVGSAMLAHDSNLPLAVVCGKLPSEELEPQEVGKLFQPSNASHSSNQPQDYGELTQWTDPGQPPVGPASLSGKNELHEKPAEPPHQSCTLHDSEMEATNSSLLGLDGGMSAGSCFWAAQDTAVGSKLRPKLSKYKMLMFLQRSSINNSSFGSTFTLSEFFGVEHTCGSEALEGPSAFLLK